jgi:hypothetical protein
VAILNRRLRLTLAFLVMVLAPAAAQAQVNEYQVKAAFLYNFARYVEWPPQAFNSASDPIVICVAGQSPFGTSLEEAVSGKSLAGRRLVVREISAVGSKCNCQILFVTAAERKRFHSAVGELRDSAVLTVGDTPGFTRDGGVINFRLEDGKVRFEINVEAAEQEHLHISSKLLSLAEIVKN